MKRHPKSLAPGRVRPRRTSGICRPMAARCVTDAPYCAEAEASLSTIHYPLSTASRGFTLVEMLVVVTIIGILASLITAAAISARRRAKVAAVVMEIKQLEMACQAYKERFGEYPPDFTGIGTTTAAADNDGKSLVIRHLAKAFPRYVPGVLGGGTGWTGFVNDLKHTNGWGIVFPGAQPAGPMFAIVFWLGGKPIWTNPPPDPPPDRTRPVTGFAGFSANPLNPFDNSPSRIGPFFDFDLSRVGQWGTGAAGTAADPGTPVRYWGPGTTGNKTTGAITYLRAENGTYLYRDPTTGATSNPRKWGSECTATGSYGNTAQRVYPAVDTRLDINNACINPQSFQIFCSGFDATYARPAAPNDRLLFPGGANYTQYHYDDITNFSNGTLEDAIP